MGLLPGTLMTRTHNGSAVPRHLIFVLRDGTPVIQWSDRQVQEVLSGKYRDYTDGEFGRPVSDLELQQLHDGGRVEHFNRAYVWLYPLPEARRFVPEPRVQERSTDRIRGYYLNTTLPADNLSLVQAALAKAGLAHRYHAVVRTELVAIVSVDMPLLQLKYAEQVQQQLQASAPDLFKQSVIAFVDLPAQNGQYRRAGTSELLDLSHIIAAQTDTDLTEGKQAVIVCRTTEAAADLEALLREMKMTMRTTTSGREALSLLEELHPDLLVMELQLPDMHGWQMLAKLREINTLGDLVTVVIAEQGTSPDGQSFGLGVAKVNVFLVKPFSMGRLRQNIWQAFQRRVAGHD
jgi:CheY-like chemotaxis protein